VGTESEHQIHVASTPACPPDAWNQADYRKMTFPGERGSDDDKAGLAMAASPDGLRLFLVYTGLRPNKVYLKWMFIDRADGGTVEQWSRPIPLPGSGSEDDAPSIAVSADSIYVAFTDKDNFMYVDRADAPKSAPQADDTIQFDAPVVLPHNRPVHRTDSGPSLTIYKSNFGNRSQTKKDNLLLSYITQTQCMEACKGILTCHACRHLVLDFLDTTSPATLARPFAVEFSRIFSDEKTKGDFEFSPSILGLADGVAVAFRQNRSDGPNNDDRDIHVKKFSDDEMAGLFAIAQSQGAGNVYGDWADERGIPFRDEVNGTGQSTPNDPDLAALPACNGAAVDTSRPMRAALVWRGGDEKLSVEANVVRTRCPARFEFAFDDTTDHTPAYANALFDKRTKAVVEGFACRALVEYRGRPVAGASAAVLARLALSSVLGTDHCRGNANSATKEAESWIESQSCSGNDLGTHGEWDVDSSDFVRLFYQWPKANTDSGVRNFLLKLVDGSSQKCTFRENPVGPIHNGDETVASYVVALVKETENHLLFMESNRYLYNQTKNPSDNTNVNDNYSVQQWLGQRLQAIFQGYFYEYNSGAYEKYSSQAISNLFEYSDDPSIKTGARMILDLLSAHEALATKDLRRMTPFRRHPLDWAPDSLLPDRTAAWAHPERARYQILNGESRMLKNACPDNHDLNLVATALGTYRIPDPILDRTLNRSHQRGFERIHLTNRGSLVMHANPKSNKGDGWEVFFQDPDFLISSGGVATQNQYGRDCGILGFACAAENENGQDVWTTVMPSGSVTNAGLTLHIEQPRELNTNEEYNLSEGSLPTWRKTCVGPNFACGRHVVVPSSLCQEQNGQFRFIDFTKNCVSGIPPDPSEDHGFYAAVFTGSDDWGFFEVEGMKTISASIATLQQFEQAVLAKNGSGSFRSDQMNAYTTLQGDTLRFGPIPKKFDAWNLAGITRSCDAAVNPAACRAVALPVIDGRAPSFESFLAEGDLMTNTDPVSHVQNSLRRWIRNPYTCQELIMDFADASNPFYVDPQNTANRLCDRGPGPCRPPCNATPTGACSCPGKTACMPPSDVTGPMKPVECLGQFVQFAIEPTTCPTSVALWSASSSFGSPDSTFVDGDGARAAVVLNGKPLGTPAVGFQFEFPSVLAIPVHQQGILDLLPGRYIAVAANRSDTLILHGGDYIFDSIVLSPGSRLQLPADERVRIFATSTVQLNPEVVCTGPSGVVPCDPAGVAANLGVMDVGVSDAIIGVTMAGTIVAPNASIRVAARYRQTVYGSFWSKVGVVVGPSVTVVVPSANVFFDASELPAYPACH
jgi:hypothetical protein